MNQCLEVNIKIGLVKTNEKHFSVVRGALEQREAEKSE